MPGALYGTAGSDAGIITTLLRAVRVRSVRARGWTVMGLLGVAIVDVAGGTKAYTPVVVVRAKETSSRSTVVIDIEAVLAFARAAAAGLSQGREKRGRQDKR